MNICNAETGVCELTQSFGEELAGSVLQGTGATVHYVGDPMCSWCWGVAPVIKQVAAHCAAHGIAFEVTVGGLRAGGGDPWTPKFKTFLRGEWSRIAQVTGQPFGFGLLDLPHFDYDTEPACRAIVVAQRLLAQAGRPSQDILPFFSAVQHHFYVLGQDPKAVDFYKAPCELAQLPFAAFELNFGTEQSLAQTRQHFVRCRQMGVRSFPSLLLECGDQCSVLAAGFTNAAAVIERLESALAL